MERILIACYSHLYMPTTLTIILKNPQYEYYIFTDNISIKKMFDSSQLNVRVILQPFTSYKLSSLFQILNYKKNILSYIRSLNITQIYFFHDGECMPFNWLISKLHNDVKICYVPLFNDNLPLIKFPTYRQVYRAIKTFFFWGIKVRYMVDRSNNQYFTESFIEMNRISTGRVEIDKKLIRDNMQNICPGIENMKDKILIVQSEHVGKIIDEKEYIDCINEVINSLGKERFVFKAKPNWEKCYGMENACQHIPSYISANLLVSQFKACIGTTSALLGEACNENVPTYSMLDIFSSLDIEETNRFKRYLQSLDKDIVYPLNINDLIKNLRSL